MGSHEDALLMNNTGHLLGLVYRPCLVADMFDDGTLHKENG
jgi:hypothetical protein